MTDREQQVKIGDTISGISKISYGVPQGSVLGPTLFLIYVNDLCNMKLENCSIFTYADDTALIFHANSWLQVQQMAESGVHHVSNWLTKNLLTLNVRKTKFITFSIRENSLPDFEFTLKVHACVNPATNNCACEKIESDSKIKYLGVIIDQHLTWRPHILNLSEKIRKLMWVFKKLRYVADVSLLHSTYKALAQSVLTYCITVWGGASKTHFMPIERSLRALLKVMHFKPIRFSTYQLHTTYNILTARQNYILSTVLKKHKNLLFNPNIMLRRRNYIVCSFQKPNTEFVKKHFKYQSSSIYNKVNKTLKIYPLTKVEIKHILSMFLINLTYEETENIIN